MAFTGKITNIEDDKVQFHIEKRWLWKDDYVECKFENKGDIISLDKGDMVTLIGNLDKVSGVVIFKNCGFYSNRHRPPTAPK